MPCPLYIVNNAWLGVLTKNRCTFYSIPDIRHKRVLNVNDDFGPSPEKVSLLAAMRVGFC